MDTMNPIKPFVLAHDQGPAYWFLGSLARVKATGEQTGGTFAMVEKWCPAGFATPLHIHRREDEAWYVVEGEVTFFIGCEEVKAGPGAFVFAPRNVQHGYRVEGNRPSRITEMSFPSGIEGLVMAMGEPALNLSHPPFVPKEQERLKTVAAHYGVEILGSLPE
jgi:mannose-6-phosphate isomerase-like protein (cupin superfamily)